MSLEQPENKESAHQGLLEVQTEKLFWRKVAEEIKKTDFRRIYETIFADIESENYTLARQALREEFRKIIAEKSPAMYGNTDQRGSAFLILKEEFYKLFPEIEALLEGTEEDRKVKTKRPTGELGKEDDSYEKWEQEKGKYWVEELEWPVPKGSELVPGLVIALSDLEAKRMENIELLGYPRFEDGDLFVKVKWNGEDGNIKLADFGLVADTETGLWNSRYKPLLWEIQKK